MTTESLGTKQCPRCLLAITEVSVVVTCEICGTAYHEECWKEQGGCAAPGCSPAPRAAAPTAAEMPSAIPPPPPPGFTPVGVPVEGALPVPADVSLGTAMSYGWNAFTRYAAPVLLATLIFTLCQTILGNIPVINFFFGVLISPVLQGGMIILAMKALRGDGPQAGDLFAGFANYGRWLGAYWLFAGIGLAFMIPAIIVFTVTLIGSGIAAGGLAALGSREDFGKLFATMGPALIASALVMLVMLIIAIAVMIRWMFVNYLIAEGYGVLEAFGHSSRMTQGQRGQLFGIAFVLGLIIFVGAMIIAGIIGVIGGKNPVAQGIASIIGTMLTAPYISCMFAALYYAVKAQRGT